MYSALNIAQYIIMRCNEKSKTISNLKLQKILYFVQAEFLVAKNQPCFSEKIEAWDFGPVVPVVYHRYKVYGGASIPFIGTQCYTMFRDNDQQLIDGIIDDCAPYSASTLVEITHHQSPWQDAYSPYYTAEITNDSIKRFFERR